MSKQRNARAAAAARIAELEAEAAALEAAEVNAASLPVEASTSGADAKTMPRDAGVAPAHDAGASAVDGGVPRFFTDPRRFVWLMLITGLIGLFASFSLTMEYIHKLQHPNDDLVCDLNVFVTCGPAMMSYAARIFGFPNVIIGLVSFTIVIVTAMATWAGARMKSWYWLGMQIGVIFAACLISFLQWFSVFQLARLCLWCMIIWSVTIPLTVGVTTFNAVNGVFGPAVQRLGRKLSHYWWVIALVWALIVVGVILTGMWDTISMSIH